MGSLRVFALGPLSLCVFEIFHDKKLLERSIESLAW